MWGNLIVLLFFKKFDILLLQTFYIMIVLFCAHNDFISCNFHFQYYNDFFLISLQNVVPFRDSVLTKLLKNALGGNSKTIMVKTLFRSKLKYEFIYFFKLLRILLFIYKDFLTFKSINLNN